MCCDSQQICTHVSMFCLKQSIPHLSSSFSLSANLSYSPHSLSTSYFYLNRAHCIPVYCGGGQNILRWALWFMISYTHLNRRDKNASSLGVFCLTKIIHIMLILYITIVGVFLQKIQPLNLTRYVRSHCKINVCILAHLWQCDHTSVEFYNNVAGSNVAWQPWTTYSRGFQTFHTFCCI